MTTPASPAGGARPGDGDDRGDGLPEHFTPEPGQVPAYACVLKGVGDAMAGAVMGSVFGFGSGLFQKRGFKGALGSSLTSAKTFAILSGMHGFVTALLVQIRGKRDALNSGIAGCATGLALSAPGNPAALLQGCATFGLFSYFIERMNTQTAVAAVVAPKGRRQRKMMSQELQLPVLPPFTLPPAFMEGLFLFNQPKMHLLPLSVGSC